MSITKEHMVWCLSNDWNGSKPCNCGATPTQGFLMSEPKTQESRTKPKFVQSISATGIITTNGAAAIFCPDSGVENTDGIALLCIRIKRSTLERLSGERVTLVIYPASHQPIPERDNQPKRQDDDNQPRAD